MPYDKTISWEEFERLPEQAAKQLFSALRNGEDFYAKLLSIADGETNAQIAARFDINSTPFATAAEVEAAVADIRAVALALNSIVSGVSQANMDALIKFA